MMTHKLKFLLVVASVLVACTSLAIHIAREKKSVQQAQLEKNLREARLEGTPDLEHAAKIEIRSRIFDIGVVSPLDRVSRVFTVHNQGRRPLVVRLVDRACSCVAVTIHDDKIAPGRSGVIDITFTAPTEEKTIDHAVQFSTNDPLQTQFTIDVEGVVRRTVWTEPRELDFVGLLPNESCVRELRVFSSWEEGCEVTRISGLPDGLEIAQQPLSAGELAAAGAKSGQLLTVTASATWVGKSFAPFAFDAVRPGSNERMHKSVQLNASRLSRISLSHDLLDTLGKFEIGNVPYGAGREYTLFLEARGEHRELSLARVEATPAFLQVSLDPGVNVATSGLHRLKLAIPEGAPVGSFAGEDQATITLHFDDPQYPSVTFHPSFHITRD